MIVLEAEQPCWQSAGWPLHDRQMTLFATKQVNLADLDQVQSTIADLQRKLRAPPDLMMLSAETADPLKRDVYIGVPSAVLLIAFPGFVEVAREALPNLLTPVVAQADKFEALFPDILRKCRDQFARQASADTDRR